jgi:hypothetical protein
MLPDEKMKHVNGLQSAPSLMKKISQMPPRELVSSYPQFNDFCDICQSVEIPCH